MSTLPRIPGWCECRKCQAMARRIARKSKPLPSLLSLNRYMGHNREQILKAAEENSVKLIGRKRL